MYVIEQFEKNYLKLIDERELKQPHLSQKRLRNAFSGTRHTKNGQKKTWTRLLAAMRPIFASSEMMGCNGVRKHGYLRIKSMQTKY